MLRIFWGPDTFSRTEAVARLKQELDSDGMLSANTSVFDGAHLNVEALVSACDTVPFLAAHRLVVVEALLVQAQPRAPRRKSTRRTPATQEPAQTIPERLAAYAVGMPLSTTLLLLEGDIRADSPGLTALEGTGESTRFARKSEQELRGWLALRAAAIGAAFEPAAAALLIESTRGDLWLLAQELEKLSLYAAGRAVTTKDVQELVPAAQEANVFVMVEGVMDGRLPVALGHLELLVTRGAAGPYLLTMIARQVRLLIIAEDLLRRGRPQSEVATAVEMRDGAPGLRRLIQQARRADPTVLRQQLEAVAATDAAIKRGEIDEQVGLCELVVHLGSMGAFRHDPAGGRSSR